MTEVAFTDASGNVRLRGTLEPPPGGSALTVTDGSTPVADVTEILLVGAQTSDNGGGIVQVDIAPGLTDVLGVSDDAGGHDITNVVNVVLDGSGSFDANGGGIGSGGGNIDAGAGNVTTSSGAIKTLTGHVETPLVKGVGTALVLGSADDALGFFGAAVTSAPQVSALPTVQNVVDALVALGLITQAA